jgi:hypothetical protein
MIFKIFLLKKWKTNDRFWLKLIPVYAKMGLYVTLFFLRKRTNFLSKIGENYRK